MIVEAPRITFDPKPLPKISNEMHIVDNPPAYSSHPNAPPSESMSTGNPGFLSPTVDQVHIFSRHEDIKGTFCIDPRVPLLDQSRRRCKRRSQQMPHASFRTRKANISIDLATAGDAYDLKKANVNVASHKGDININLLPTLPVRPIGLDVTSRKGNIVLFVPDTFSGVVHLTTRKGDMVVLPALTNSMKVIKTSGKEIMFTVTPKHLENRADNTSETTLCQLNTRKGNIVVGLGGYDQYASPPSFWKKLGCYLRGDKI